MNARKSTVAEIQQQSTLALEIVSSLVTADKHMMITTACIDTHTNELMCVFMDRKEKTFVQRKYPTDGLLSRYHYINNSAVSVECHNSLVDLMARGKMFIYRNTNEPLAIFNNGIDNVLILPFETMIKYTMHIYGHEPVLQVTQRGFVGTHAPLAPQKESAKHIADYLHTLEASVKPTQMKIDEQEARIVKVTAFKNKVRINLKQYGLSEVREIENNDLTNSLWKMFGGNGGVVGGKLRRLVKNKNTMDKSKLYVIYSDDVMVGGFVSFVENRSAVNGYVSEASIIKYIKRFMEAGLDSNICNIVTK